MARSSAYWQARRRKQLGRFGGKTIKAVSQPSVASVAQAAWSGVKYLRTLVNSELHKVDSAISTTADNNGFVNHISAIAQGDGITNRTGQSLLCASISFKQIIAIHPSNVTAFMRVIFFRDEQQISDTTPAITDVLATVAITSHLNPATTGRFKILHDEIIALGSAGPQVKAQRKFIKIDKHIRYNGTAGTDIQKGGIYLLMFSDQGANIPSHVTNVRITWHDN